MIGGGRRETTKEEKKVIKFYKKNEKSIKKNLSIVANSVKIGLMTKLTKNIED